MSRSQLLYDILNILSHSILTIDFSLIWHGGIETEKELRTTQAPQILNWGADKETLAIGP